MPATAAMAQRACCSSASTYQESADSSAPRHRGSKPVPSPPRVRQSPFSPIDMVCACSPVHATDRAPRNTPYAGWGGFSHATGWERREVPCGDIESDASMWHLPGMHPRARQWKRERKPWAPSSYPDVPAARHYRQASGQRTGSRRVWTTRLDPTAAPPSSPRSPSPLRPRAVGVRSDQLAARSDEDATERCDHHP